MKNKPSKETLNDWQSDPSNWKFGLIYFNKNDKRVIVPKKMRILGWTLNFANPYFVFPLLIIAIIYIILKNF